MRLKIFPYLTSVLIGPKIFRQFAGLGLEHETQQLLQLHTTHIYVVTMEKPGHPDHLLPFNPNETVIRVGPSATNCTAGHHDPIGITQIAIQKKALIRNYQRVSYEIQQTAKPNKSNSDSEQRLEKSPRD